MFSCNRCIHAKHCKVFLKITHVFVDHFLDFDPDSMPMIYEMIGMACNRFQVEKRRVA